ncbi:MAG: HD domain-containing protein, partial [Lactobacillus iners]|nr:HD domain-containing protein [Lactobacillus iners]
HTLSMLRDADAISKNYPQVNQSLLFAGCILHDLGKVIEFTGPVATRYTMTGNLLGHLVIGDEEIVLAANELKIDIENEDVVLLRHMVISHHGLPEYGAAKRPALLEAELLHRIDDLDASIYEITKALQETKPGEFSSPIFAQDGRKFYRPKNSELGKIDKLN